MSEAAALYAKALVWDQTFPATPACGSWASHLRMLERMKASGYSAASITVAYDPDDSRIAIQRIGVWRRIVEEHADDFLLLGSAEDAREAKAQGKLALGFHFQGTTPSTVTLVSSISSTRSAFAMRCSPTTSEISPETGATSAQMPASVAQDPSRCPPDHLYQLDVMELGRPEQVPELCERMVSAGYPDEDVCAILGGNWLRLAREVRKASAGGA